MNKIVISQPMFLPWVGMFEQLNLSDTFVHYDDVQFPQGSSFINRVQLKTKDGIKWLSVPIDKKNSGKLINETLISYAENWQEKHVGSLQHAFAKCRYKNDVFILLEKIYSHKFETISDLNIFSFELIADYFEMSRKFILSSSIETNTHSSQKLLDIIKNIGGNKYITGMGALNYIDYDLFEKENIQIDYMNYLKTPYSQQFDSFTPYVTILDLIANEGKAGKKLMNSTAVYWKEFDHFNSKDKSGNV